MRKYQNGISLIGWILLLIPYAIIGYTVEGITDPALDDIDIRRENGHWTLEVGYDVAVKLFGGVSVHVAFDKRVDIP